MTTPAERTQAVSITEQVLLELLDPKKTPKVPLWIRVRAQECLRHYPRKNHLVRSATEMPGIWGQLR